MDLEKHPIWIAAATFATTLSLAATIVFTAIIPTWLQRKDNEIADLKAQAQSLAIEPTRLKIQLAKLEREGTDRDAGSAASAKRIEELEKGLAAERLAKKAAEQRAADESTLRRQIEDRARKNEEIDPPRAQKELEKRITDLEQQVETERKAREAAESRLITETKLKQEAEQRSQASSAGSTTNPEQTVTAKTFDLGTILATADWARSDRDHLEVSFTFTNKTARPLWLIPATPRSEGGIQASDDLKNSYELETTVGFRRGLQNLRGDYRSQNKYLELQPGVASPATFNFTRKRGATDGATHVRFFATLTIVEDLQTLKSYNKTVTATLSLK